ncbi:MAG: thiamine pyrophosphate-dependent dehydrogenase E1 component subunit alpha [Actinobacteria bacterium]|nr:thiamine pyrophosphate-dependent dehydrogenase E1 component subunit alpha [Actinomycetota bacterium]
MNNAAYEKNAEINAAERKEILAEIGKDKAVGMLQRMIEIREFEERIRLLFLEGKMPGTIHQYIGQEACAVGVCWALEKDDVIASNHRPHGHAIARGLPIGAIMAELYGKTTGCCRGKGGSMHIGDLSKGMLPAIAIVGGNIPIVGGMALAFKLRREPRVSISFFGDGASNEGAFHEGLNMAQIYKVPAVFVCENNLYGASTSIKLTTKVENIADRACAYGMRSDIGDGMDVLDVYRRAKNAADFARNGEGPTLLELKTFRLCGHSRRDPNNYMTKEERQYWKSRDPIILFESLLLDEGIMDDKEVLNLRKKVDGIIDRAVEFGQTSPDPKPEDTYKGLYVSMEVPR